MKNKMKMLALILVVIFSLVIFPLSGLLPTAKATYVEGEITIDTVWTLVDSPFILSGNVTVRGGVTLTIEPGVEVRFGGKFSLIVNGRLIAKGTSESNKLIIFTSNKETPEPGDWGTLYFNGTSQPPSLLENCIIEYGTNGTTIANGELTVRNVVVRLNSVNGIMMFSGSVTIESGTLICNNTASGIYISGGDVTVKASNVTFNRDGITFSGSLATSNINVTGNNINFNEHSGISLIMEDYDRNRVTIRNNRVFFNGHGFYVSTNETTSITRNYIQYNNVGIFYELGAGHEAHFNDICYNNLGMDVSANATVDATRNFWGDENGPYHEWLNPHGKGNPVGGDGVNLDFIFFLTAPIGYNNALPTAVLWTDKDVVAIGQEVAFVGFNSFDDRRVDQYFYDFGDGRNSGWTTLSIFFHKYTATGNYTARLVVMDDFGNVSSPVTKQIRVVNLPSLNVGLVIPSGNVVTSGGEIQMVARVSLGGNPVGGANVTFYSIKGGDFEAKSGSTNSSGYFTTLFTAPSVTDITDIRIIVKASNGSCADGSYHQYLTVLPPLTVHVTSQPSEVLSGENSTVSVDVSWVGEPVENALVTLSSTHGNFTESEKLTDYSGRAVFTFKALLTSEEIAATIVAHASKEGFADGEGQTTITIMPKIFQVYVKAERNTTVSEEISKVTVHVEYNGTFVEKANVTLSADMGAASPTFAYTNGYGDAVFNFTTPPVEEETNITLTATVSKLGYAINTSTLMITAKPGILTIMVVPRVYSAASESQVDIDVYVTCDGRPVAGANITVSLSAGTLISQPSGTDANGYCMFSILTPRTDKTMDLMVTVSAEKFGYVGSPTGVSLTVVPKAGGGIPWLTILLVLIPVLLAVLIVVLVKLGVIQFSFGGEEEGGSIS